MWVVYLVVILTVVAVAVAGLVAVGNGVGNTRKMPKQIVLDVEESIEFCAESLPVEVSSVLSYDELRRAMRLHLEWIQSYHWAPETADKGDDNGPVVFEEFDALDYVMERADVIKLNITRDQAHAVLSVHTSYLQVMGAIHLDDPALVEADLAEAPMLGGGGQPLLDADNYDSYDSYDSYDNYDNGDGDDKGADSN